MNESLSAKLCHFGRAVVELDFYDPRVLRTEADDSQPVAGSQIAQEELSSTHVSFLITIPDELIGLYPGHREAQPHHRCDAK